MLLVTTSWILSPLRGKRMKHLVLISHGLLCEALKGSAEMIMGQQENIHTVALLPEEGPDEFEKKFLETITDLDDFMVFADLFGGTPCNVAGKIMVDGRDFQLYSGMNLPMIISFINGELIGSAAPIIDDGQSGIQFVNEILATTDDEDEV